jgi:hypothetical protein
MNVVVSVVSVFCTGVPTTDDIGLDDVGVETVLWVTVVVDDCGVAVCFDWVEMVVMTSFSGQNKITRIAIISKMIAMVGQCDLVNDQNDDACAVCGASGAAGVVGVTCATTGTPEEAVVVSVELAVVVAAIATAGVDGVFSAMPVLCIAGAVATTGLVFDIAIGAAPFAVMSALMFAVMVLRMPAMLVSVACTPCCSADVITEFAETVLFNCPRAATSVLKVLSNELTSAAVSVPVVANGITMLGEVVTGVTVIFNVDEFTVPVELPFACISKFTNVACATSSCCCNVAVAVMSVDVMVCAFAAAICPP